MVFSDCERMILGSRDVECDFDWDHVTSSPECNSPLVPRKLSKETAMDELEKAGVMVAFALASVLPGMVRRQHPGGPPESATTGDGATNVCKVSSSLPPS